jgi:hypothetical protein
VACSSVTPARTAGPAQAARSAATLPDGGGSPGPSCRLVTLEEVEHATNLPFLPGETNDTDCTYDGDGSLNNFTSVVIGTDPNYTIAAAKADFNDGHDVSGIGHAAYWSPSLPELWVELGGNRTFQIQLVQFDLGPDYLPVALALARIAISRA